jgi:hypothetical protein
MENTTEKPPFAWPWGIAEWLAAATCAVPVAVFAFLLFAIVMGGIEISKDEDRCTAAGGVYLKARNGHACVKQEGVLNIR